MRIFPVGWLCQPLMDEQLRYPAESTVISAIGQVLPPPGVCLWGIKP